MKNIFVIFRLCCIGTLFTLGPVVAQGACDPPPAGLVSWWAAEGNAYDQISANNGTLVGGVSYGSGEVGQGFVLNGNGQGVSVAGGTNLWLQNLTIETWIKRASPSVVSYGSGGNGVIFGYGSSGGNAGYYLFYMDSLGELRLSQNGNSVYLTGPAITDTGFHHVALTKTGGTVVFYVDGVAYPAPAFNTTFTFSDPAGIGYRPDNGDNSFYGVIDELSIYNRALSQSEIQGIYNGGSGGKCFTPVAPTIISEPTNEIVLVGQPASFSVSAGGTPPLSYQWNFNTTNIMGATNATLMLTSVQLTNAGNYAVLVSNAVSSVLSSNAVLTVNSLPCDLPPAGLVSWWAAEGNAYDQISANNGTLVGGVSYGSGEVGQGFVLNGNGQGVSVAGGTNLWLQNLTIETWIKRASPSVVSYGSGGNGVIFGYGSSGGNAGYYLFYMDSLGELRLSQNGNSVYLTGPAITDTGFHHVALTKTGGTVVFYVDGVAYPAPAFNTTFTFSDPAGIGYRPDNGDNSFYGVIDELSIYNRALSQSEIQGIYNGGSGGKCFTPVAPTITSEPTNEIVLVGQPASFSVSAGGTPPFSYQWSFNTTNIAEATNATLTLTSAQLTNAGNYAVLVSNAVSSTLSSNAVLTVNPLLSCDPAPGGVVAWWRGEGNATDAIGTNNGTLENGAGFTAGEVGQTFVFAGSGEAVQLGNPTDLQLQDFTIETWVQRGSASSSTPDPGQTTAAFMAYGYGGYGLGIVDDGGLFLTRVGIDNVTIPNLITDTNWHHVAVTKSGTSVIFYVDGVSYPAPSPYTSVFDSDTDVAIGARGDNLANSFLGSIDELSVYNRALTPSEIQGIYNAGSGGKCFTPVAPVITSQPTNETVFVGQSASFSVMAAGTPPFSYQWSFNTTNIAWATNATLTLTSAQLTNAGNYAVLVSNAVSSILSSNAVLTVNPLPSCDPAPVGLVSWWAAEGNAYDQISGYDGTLIGGVSYGSGEVGQGFVFNGNGQGVQVAGGTNLWLQNLTIETWVKRASASVVSYGSGGNGVIFGYVSDGYLFFMNSVGELVLSQLGNPVSLNGPAITDTGFHHVAMTKSGGTVVFYVDGVAYPAPAFNTTFTFTGAAGIGYRPDNGDNSFYGLIDELSVYNRALTPSEIQGIYNAGSGGKCPAPCLPHIATGVAILTNALVGGVNITDEGCGYTNAPLIHLIGGGGSGAQAIAVVSNGVVVAINMINAGSGYTSAPSAVIDPPFISNPILGIASISVLNFSNLLVGTNYQLQKFQSFQSTTWINQSASFKATNSFYTTMVSGAVGSGDYRLAQIPVPVQATAIAQVDHGFVVNVVVNNPGSGYVTVPAVAIFANVGSNATAVASISNGRVTSIAVTGAGIHYVNPVTVQIDPPPAIALSPTVVTGIRLDSSVLAPYDNYQFQFKPVIANSWSDLNGGLFSSPAATNSQYFFLTNESGFFRLRYLP